MKINTDISDNIAINKNRFTLPSPPDIIEIPADVLADIYMEEDDSITNEIISDDIVEFQKACLI